jgi:hypothetical protein
LKHPKPAVLWVRGFLIPGPTVVLFWACSTTRTRQSFYSEQAQIPGTARCSLHSVRVPGTGGYYPKPP